jgi:hypothetical protein
MVHGFKPGKHVKKLYSYHKVSTNTWFQTMILHEYGKPFVHLMK